MAESETTGTSPRRRKARGLRHEIAKRLAALGGDDVHLSERAPTAEQWREVYQLVGLAAEAERLEGSRGTPQHVSFRAKYVPFLAQFSAEHDPTEHRFFPRLDLYGLRVEPHPEGGVWLTALSTAGIAQVHDRTGRCSRPCVISLHVDFVRACTAPSVREYLTPDHGPWEPELPAWMRPGTVLATWDEGADAGSPVSDAFGLVIVGPEKQPPDWTAPADEGLALYVHSRDFGGAGRGAIVYEDEPISMPPIWDEPVVPVERIKIAPRLLGLFAAAGRLGWGPAEFTFAGAVDVIRVTFSGAPHVRVAIMPCGPKRTEAGQGSDVATEVPTS